MWKRAIALGFVVGITSVASAGVNVNVVADPTVNVGALTPGQTFDVFFDVSQDTGTDHSLRNAQFDFSLSDSAIGLNGPFNWDESSIPSFGFGFGDSYALFDTLPIPSAASQNTADNSLTMWTLPGSGSLRIGSLSITAPTTAGNFVLDSVTPTDLNDDNIGGFFSFGFGLSTGSGDDILPITDNRPRDGSLTGGQLTLTVVPEPATLAFLALGGLALLRRRRTA